MSFASASGAWNNPPPPGTLDDPQLSRSSKDKAHGKSMKENYRRYSRSRSRSSEENRRSRSRSIKNSRSHSRSRDRDYSSRRHDRHHKSRSDRRSSRHKRHKHSRSRKYSRSRSRSYSRSRRHRRSYTRSRTRSRCKDSRSRSQSWSSGSYSDRSSNHRNRKSKNYVPEVPKNQEYIRKVYSKQNEVSAQENNFKNDGSFLEMFKKMQEEKEKEEKKAVITEAAVSEVKKTIPIFGKRRGGKVLKTGVVEKLKNPNEVEEEPKDAWSVYMKEVKRYKEACCDDDSKTRPLVK